MNKELGLAGGVVLLVGIIAYTWVTRSSSEADVGFAHAKESFSCSQCGNLFDMTAEKAKQQLQSGRQAYACPSCNENGALKNDIPPPIDEDSGDDKDELPRPVGVRQLVQQ